MPTIDQRAVVLPNATYPLTGGTGGIGRSATRWLLSQGAKHIVLASRSGMSQISTRDLVEELKQNGVNVVVYACDIGEEEQVRNMVSFIHEAMPPIRGVLHGAMVIQVRIPQK